MNTRKAAIFSLAALLAAAAAQQAVGQPTYFVAPLAGGGSDANSGASGSPWLTLQRAANAVAAGDNVVIAAGTYVGFNVGRSGLPGQPISFLAQPGVIVNAPAATFNGTAHKARINLDSVSWIVIDGFEVVGTNDLRDSKAGIRIVAPPNSSFGNITIRNNFMHHNGQWGLLTGHVGNLTVENNVAANSHQQHGIYLSNSGDNHVVRGNISRFNAQQGFHFNGDISQGGDGVMSNLLIESNIAHDNAVGGTYIDTAGVTRTSLPGGSAINCDGVRASTIRNNLLYRNHASGISLYQIDGGLPSAGNVVANNTIVNGSPPSDSGTRWCINITDAATGNTLFNNVLLNYHPTRGSLIVSSDSRPGLISDYNIVMDRIDPGTGTVGTLAAWRTLTGNDTHSLVVPATQWASLFAGLAANDYRLPPASTARDAGTSGINGQSAPIADLVGVPRPRGPSFDIGAYEFDLPTLPCAADFNGIGGLTVQDIFDFLAAYFAGSTLADFNGAGGLSVQDVFDFLAAYFAGCA